MGDINIRKELFYEEKLNSLLLKIRIMPNVKGYHILKDCVLQISMDSSKKINMNKSLYPILAKHYNITTSQVERRLKIVCDCCKRLGDKNDLSMVFGRQNIDTISVKQIICLLAERIKLEYSSMLLAKKHIFASQFEY